MNPWKKKGSGYLITENNVYSYENKKSKLLKKEYKVHLEQEGETLEEAAKIKAKLESENIKIGDEAEEIKKIHAKKKISTAEFAKIYGISKRTQQDLRSRMYDSLPFNQIVENGNISYNVKEVEEWFQNQYK